MNTLYPLNTFKSWYQLMASWCTIGGIISEYDYFSVSEEEISELWEQHICDVRRITIRCDEENPPHKAHYTNIWLTNLAFWHLCRFLKMPGLTIYSKSLLIFLLSLFCTLKAFLSWIHYLCMLHSSWPWHWRLW